MADKFWGPIHTTWSSGNNWYEEDTFTTPTTKPGSADDAYFIDGSAHCDFDENAEVNSIRFDQYGGYNGKEFSFGYQKVLMFRSIANFSSPNAYTLNLNPTDCTLRYNGTIGNGNFTSKAGATWTRLYLYNAGAVDRTLYFNTEDFTVKDLVFAAISTGDLFFSGVSGEAFIQTYGVTGGAHVDAASGSGIWWQTNVDIDDFDSFLGHQKFGYDTDVEITLPASSTIEIGTSWYFENHSSSDIEITVVGSGNIDLSDTLYIRTYGTGDLTVDWSGASLTLPAGYDDWIPNYVTSRANIASQIILDFGDDNEFGAQAQFDFTYVSEFRGGTSTLNVFKMKGDVAAYYYGPKATLGSDPDPVNSQLPGTFTFLQYTSSSHTLRFSGGVDIAGDVTITQDTNSQNVYFETPPTEQPTAIFRKKFIYNNTVAAGANIYYDRDVIHYGDFDLTSTTSNSVVRYQSATVDFYGSVWFRSTALVAMNSDAVCRIHVPRKAERTLHIGSTCAIDFSGTWEIYLDDATDHALTYDFFLESLRAGVVNFGQLTIHNKLDEQMLVLFQGADATDKYLFDTLEIKGRGDGCVVPRTDDEAVVCQSHSAGTQWRFSIGNESYPEWTTFQDARNDGGAGTQPILANDGTCFDGGNNDGVTFTGLVMAIAICPDEEADFSSVRYDVLPALQTFQVINLGVGDLPQPSAAGVPGWLDVSFVDNDDGTWSMLLQPNTTILDVDTYEDEFAITVVGARRSPLTFGVSYEILPGVLAVPAVDQVDFYRLRLHSVPALQTVEVDNSYPAGGTLQQIEILNLPAWLDVAYTVTGPADHQEFTLTVNATGAALGIGTYNVDIGIDAPNAVAPYILPVELVVESLLIDISPSRLDFSMKVGGVLPYETLLNVSNSGTAGTLEGVTATPSEAWLATTVPGSGNGNSQNVLVELNAGAQALGVGTYAAQITIGSTNADNVPYTVDVELVVLELEPFTLSPAEVEFTPGRNWELPAAQQVAVRATGEGSFTAPVTVTNLPTWLQATVDATDPLNQVITLTPTAIPAALDDFTATVLVTGSYSLELPVSVVAPAFFRRADCQMDFIPRIEGTIVEECEVPPPPAPAPVAPPLIPPQPAPSYPKNITMTGPPCIECEAWIVYEDEEEYGYKKPHYYIDCEDHGCDGNNLSSGTYGSIDNTPGGHPGPGENRHVTALVIDECGHVCGIYFDDDDGGS